MEDTGYIYDLTKIRSGLMLCPFKRSVRTLKYLNCLCTPHALHAIDGYLTLYNLNNSMVIVIAALTIIYN